MLIDTHAHLTDERLSSRIGEILARAKEAGVEKILVPTVGLLDGKRAIDLAEKYEGVWAMVGIHPENISHLRKSNNAFRHAEFISASILKQVQDDREENTIADVKKNLSELVSSSNKVVGIGEIGLDFYYDKEKMSKELQMKVFQEQLELAVKMDLPVVIHMREAEAEMTEILTQIERLPKGQFHCFAGSDEFLKLVLDRDFYVSYCGNITYKSADLLREQVKKVPLDRLLLETDSPYLAPEGHRGSFNEPSNVKMLAEYIADLLGLPVETLINQTTQNGLCLYFGG